MKKVIVILILMLTFCLNVFAQNDEYKDLFLAKKVFDDGFYDSALRQLKNFLQDYPYSKRNFEIEFLIAQCYFKKGQLYKASNAFESLLVNSDISQIKKTDEINFWLAETYFKA
ncbi:MAG: hypothetical protein ABIG64_09585, partial [Candidatus Omnitrophota bacterium]